jgi:hypothetical protein
MTSHYKPPIIQKDALGNLQRATSTNENYLAYQAGLRFAERGTLGPTAIKSSITIAQRDSDIGSFVDTFYNEAVGTHPGTSLSTGSLSTTLYQLEGDSASGSVKLDDQSSGLFRRPVYESDGSIVDMDSTAMENIGSRIMALIQSNEYPGAQRLAASAPSADWSATLSNVFTDTNTDGNVTQYSIWQRQTMTAPTKCNAMHIRRSSYGAYPLASYDGGLEAMTDSEMSLTFGQIAGKFFNHGEIGTYELRSSAQGAPTRTGTWVSRGTAVDTRYTVDPNVQYADPVQYSQQFTSSFAGSRNYVAQAPLNEYAGSRNYAGNYTGDRTFTSAPIQFSGSRTYILAGNFAGSRVEPSQFTGTRDYVGQRNFAGTRPTAGNFAGTRPIGGQFTGTRDYVGERTWLGNRTSVPTQFAGTRVSADTQFAGLLYYVGARTFNTTLDYLGTRPVAGNFVGNRGWAGTVFYPGNFSSTAYYAGNRLTPGTFAGNRATPGTFAGNRQTPGTFAQGPYGGYYSGNRAMPGNFAGNRTMPGNFAGNRNMPGNFAGTVNYAGSRSATAYYVGNAAFSGFRNTSAYFSSYFDYVGTRPFTTPTNFVGTRQVPGQFTGTRQVPGNFVGDRNWTSAPTQFAGFRETPGTFAGFRDTPGSFTGDRTFTSNPVQFAGTRVVPNNFAGTRPSVYAGDYTGTRDFVGQRAFAGSRNYTANYAGSRNYAGNYITQYTGQFSEQYTGETLTSTSETIETYTLYVRVA